MSKRIIILLIFVLASFLALNVIIVEPAQDEGQYGGTLVEAIGTEPTNIDIFKAARRPESTIIGLIFEPLFVINEDLKVEPLLAKTWDVSEDQLTWTITLKKGITFHDGTPLNAQAVKFSLEKHKEIGSHSWMLKPVKEIKIVDDYTINLYLSKAFPTLKYYLASHWLGIVSPTAFQEAGEKWGSQVIVGTGPFKFQKWISGDRIILERHESYNHGPSFLANKGPAYAERWIVRFIPEQTTLISALTDGNVDLTDYLSGKDVPDVKKNPGTGVVTSNSTSPIYLAINCSSENPPYNNVKVRRAIAHSLNREAIIKVALFGMANPIYTIIAPTVKGFWPGSEEIGKNYTEYDPEKAKELLKEVGWVDTDGDGVREKDGEELYMNFLAFKITRYKRIAEVAKPMLESVGFKVDLKILEAGDLYERTLAGKHDILSTAYVVSQGFALDDLLSQVHSESIGSVTQWSLYTNPKVDQLLDTARFSQNPEKREQALIKTQKIVAKEVPSAPIAVPQEMFGYKKSVGGIINYTEHPWCFDQVDFLRALELYKK